jgi:hypothetical protein
MAKAAKAVQLTLWNERTAWNDVRLPDAYFDYYLANHSCLNCRAALRHPMHALNHYKKLHMTTKYRFFVWYFGMWNEVSQAAFSRAKKKRIATARTK